jgi:triacylglycerol esterase/lipase EstA (alpha/beta hydrolase family)
MRTPSTRTLVRAAGAALLAIGLVGLPTAAAQAAPDAAPSSGVNDWSCQPAPGTSPVVLLHGLGAPAAGHWSYLAPHLASQGYCTYYLTYGQVSPIIPFGGFRPIAESADEIADFIDRVSDATGAAEVDLIGHSEGGFLSLYIPKMLDYQDELGTVVAISPPAHGTSFAGLVGLADGLGIRPAVNLILNTFGCAACTDLITDGPAVDELNDGPIAQDGVDYTVIGSRYDILVTPDESFVHEPGVDNVLVQDECAFDPVGHVGLAFDSGVATMITNALNPDQAQPVRCTIGLPF